MQVRLRSQLPSKALRGLLALALLVGLSRLEIAGQSCRSAFSSRRSRRTRRRRSCRARSKAAAGQGFPGARASAAAARARICALPANERPATARQGAGISTVAASPGPAALSAGRLRSCPRRAATRLRQDRGPAQNQKALSPQPPLGGWDALVRPAPLPGAPKTPTAGQTTPPLGPPDGQPHKSFRRVLEKLGQRGPRQQTPVAAPGAKPRETAEKSKAGTPPAPRRLGGRWAGRASAAGRHLQAAGGAGHQPHRRRPRQGARQGFPGRWSDRAAGPRR